MLVGLILGFLCLKLTNEYLIIIFDCILDVLCQNCV